MKKLMVAFALVSVLTGCGKEQYSDPQAFVDHYGEELLGEHYKDGMELMAYKGFKFSNAKVGIDRNGREYVSAQVSLIVPSGENYYRRLESQSAADVLKTWPSDKLSKVVGQEDAVAINGAFRKVRHNESAPIVYSADTVDIGKLVSPWRTIRIIRIKDGDGAYHPAGDIRRAVQWYAANGNEMSEMSNIPTEPFYTGVGGLLSETAIKQLGAVKDGSPEAARARESYVKRMAEINAAIARLNACCVTQAEILATAPTGTATNATPRWIWERQQKESAAFRAKVQDVRKAAQERDHDANGKLQRAQQTLRQLNANVQRTERGVSQAKRKLEEDSRQLEQLTAKAAKARRPSERTNARIEQLRECVTTTDPKAVSDAEAALADLKARIQKAETELAAAQANQAKIGEEGQASVAKAGSEGQKALDQTVERLEAEYQAVKQKSSAELKSAIDDCKQKLGLVK